MKTSLRTLTLALAGSLAFGASGAALAQTNSMKTEPMKSDHMSASPMASESAMKADKTAAKPKTAHKAKATTGAMAPAKSPSTDAMSPH